MRIADKMQFEQVRNNLGKNRTTMSELQNQAATQKRVTKPSDDPVAAARVLQDRVELDSNAQYQKDLHYALGFLEFTDQSLGELTENLIRAKELAISQANDASANQTSRRVTAAEVKQIHDQMVQIGNRKLGDRHIFGGYHTLKTPFDVDGKYTGDNGEMLIHVDKDSFVAMNIPGSKIFMGTGINEQGATVPTPNQAKSLQELKAQLQPSEQKPQEPQTVEEFEQERIPMRGPASAESSIYSKNPDLTQKTIDGKIDGPEVERQGDLSGMNLFNVMKRLQVGLLTNDKGTIQESIDELDKAVSQVVYIRSQAGARVAALQNTSDTLAKGTVEVASQVSKLEDADVFKVVSDINQAETTLKAALETSGKLIQPSLMDFIK